MIGMHGHGENLKYLMLDSSSWMEYSSLCYLKVKQQQIWLEPAFLTVYENKESLKKTSTATGSGNTDVGRRSITKLIYPNNLIELCCLCFTFLFLKNARDNKNLKARNIIHGFLAYIINSFLSSIFKMWIAHEHFRRYIIYSIWFT